MKGGRDCGVFYCGIPGAEAVVSRGARHWPWHLHLRHAVAGAVLRGQLQVATRQEKQRLGAGAWFSFAPGVAHALSAAPECALLVVCTDRPGCDPALLAASLAHAAQEAGMPPDPVLGLRAQTLLGAASAALGAAPAGAAPCHCGVPGALATAAARLELAPRSGATVAELAEAAGCSRFAFLRRFSRAFGLTPHAFLLLCRVRRARALIRSGLSLADVAAAAGFFDQSHLNRVFARCHGLTPLVFRQVSFGVFLGEGKPGTWQTGTDRFPRQSPRGASRPG